MAPKSSARPERRAKLLAQIAALADVAVFGTATKTFRTCGTPGCRCHGAGPKHGPHMYVSFRGAEGKTAGYYVPEAAQPRIREGIEAWHKLQSCLRELAEINRTGALDEARSGKP